MTIGRENVSRNHVAAGEKMCQQVERKRKVRPRKTKCVRIVVTTVWVEQLLQVRTGAGVRTTLVEVDAIFFFTFDYLMHITYDTYGTRHMEQLLFPITR